MRNGGLLEQKIKYYATDRKAQKLDKNISVFPQYVIDKLINL